VHVADRQHDTPRLVSAGAGLWLRRELENLTLAHQRRDRFVRLDVQVELLDDAAQIGQILLAGDALLVVVLNRDAGQRQPFGRAEEARIARPPGQRVPDLPGVEVEHVHADAFQADGQLDADRPGADDGDFVGVAGRLRRRHCAVSPSTTTIGCSTSDTIRLSTLASWASV
jgi:hypothetical protein